MVEENHAVEEKTHQESLRTVVGIDLGTTNSSLAVIRKGKPEIIPSPEGDKLIPSVVLINSQGEVVVGQDAAASLIAMPSRTVAAIKRKMGSTEKIPIAGKELMPEEISSLILKELKGYADRLYGEGEKEAVITVPAYFLDEQRRATKRAGELAGFVVERIINEPTAASLAFGLDHLENEGRILVYDLGGGTFDVSVVEMTAGVLEVRASEGDNQLGGEDFDWRLVDYMAEKILGREEVDPRSDLRARALLKEEAERVKKVLSYEEEAEVSLPLVTVKEDRPVGLNLKITREVFIQLIDELLLQTVDSIHKVLEELALKSSDIDEVLLVGGSTRIPRVQDLIQDFFGKAPRTDINPDEAVALGAAVQAGLKAGLLSDSGLVATDVAPYSMGVAVLKKWGGLISRPGGYAVIIPKNSTIPVTRSDLFTTATDNQEVIHVEVFQGEKEWTSGNHPLGDFYLEGIPPNRAGEEQMEISFTYNLNGILEVTARALSNGNEMTVVMKDALERDSDEALKESKNRLDSFLEGYGKEKAQEEEEEWERFKSLLLQAGEEKTETLLSMDELKEEINLLLERAQDLLEQASGKDRFSVKKAMKILNKAKKKNSREEIQEDLDEATDMLIHIEAGWE